MVQNSTEIDSFNLAYNFLAVFSSTFQYREWIINSISMAPISTRFCSFNLFFDCLKFFSSTFHSRDFIKRLQWIFFPLYLTIFFRFFRSTPAMRGSKQQRLVPEINFEKDEFEWKYLVVRDKCVACPVYAAEDSLDPLQRFIFRD